MFFSVNKEETSAHSQRGLALDALTWHSRNAEYSHDDSAPRGGPPPHLCPEAQSTPPRVPRCDCVEEVPSPGAGSGALRGADAERRKGGTNLGRRRESSCWPCPLVLGATPVCVGDGPQGQAKVRCDECTHNAQCMCRSRSCSTAHASHWTPSLRAQVPEVSAETGFGLHGLIRDSSRPTW